MTVHDRIVSTLQEAGVGCRLVQHEPVRTSEEAALVRGEPLEIRLAGEPDVIEVSRDADEPPRGKRPCSLECTIS